MDIHEAAEALNGSEYRKEGSKELFSAMREAGLVAVYGASDDLMEFNGAIRDEVGCYNGGTAHVTDRGLLTNDCDNDDCPHFADKKRIAKTIEALWVPYGGLSWSYDTTIPFATFTVNEDGRPYCRGIVFALKDAA